MSGLVGGLHLAADRAERDGFEHSNPAVGHRVAGEAGGGGSGELSGQFSGEEHPGLGRLRGELERSYHTTDADGSVDVAEPEVELLLLLGDEAFLQLGGDLTGGLVARNHRVLARGDDAAQIAQIQLLEIGECRIRAIEPLGHAQLWQQLFGNGQQPAGGDLFLALGLEPGVLFVDGLTHCGDPALQRTLGNGPLCLGKISQYRAAVLATGLQALRLRALGQFRRGLEAGTALRPGATIRTGPTGAVATVGTVATIGTRPAIADFAGSPGGAVAARAAGPVSVAARRSGGAVTAIASVTAIAVAAVTTGQGLGDGLERLVSDDQLEQTSLLRLLLASGDGENRGALELGFGLRLEHHADDGTRREE